MCKDLDIRPSMLPNDATALNCSLTHAHTCTLARAYRICQKSVLVLKKDMDVRA